MGWVVVVDFSHSNLVAKNTEERRSQLKKKSRVSRENGQTEKSSETKFRKRHDFPILYGFLGKFPTWSFELSSRTHW